MQMSSSRWRRLAIVLNMLVPGSGLVVLRREWLGLCLALLYGLLVQVVLWGLLLVPLSIPKSAVVACTIGAAAVWAGAQWLMMIRWRLVFDPEVELELERLLARADQRLDAGDYESARQILIVAKTLNDEHVGFNMRWGRLMQLTGRSYHARAAWHRVLRLAPSGEEGRQARQALAGIGPEVDGDL